ncbi:hypothetical protein CHARACLAT_032665 [Characodon lateralis]|uniref:Uncharacterized protein n=1 Tax=Characodon lateralis TaxID=208331 RepID=A0ABU7EYP4_9TELE|nr:hypothetical protein [Characodon lateralis]
MVSGPLGKYSSKHSGEDTEKTGTCAGIRKKLIAVEIGRGTGRPGTSYSERLKNSLSTGDTSAVWTSLRNLTAPTHPEQNPRLTNCLNGFYWRHDRKPFTPQIISSTSHSGTNLHLKLCTYIYIIL